MSRALLRVAFIAVLALLGFGSVTFARASIVSIDDVGGGPFATTAIPTLLGPINELGRNGWNCLPERAAAAKHIREAALPTEDEH